MVVRTVVLVTLLAFVAFISADEEFDEDGVQGKALGKSGRLLFFRRQEGKKRLDFSKKMDRAFTVEIGHLKQKDDQGRDVGKSVLTLANQAFTVAKFNKSSNYKGISAGHLKLKAYLKDPQAWLIVDIFIFREAGNVTFGNETTEVQKGTIKFFMEVKNYTFCDGQAIPSICKANKVGKYLEIAIIVKGKKGAKPKEESEGDRMNRERGPSGGKLKGLRCLASNMTNRCPKTFAVGDDTIGLSKEYKADGEFRGMPGDFPKFMEQGSKQLFLFRCKKFNNTVIFDPLVELSKDEEPVDGDDGNHATSIQLNVFMFIFLLAALSMNYVVS